MDNEGENQDISKQLESVFKEGNERRELKKIVPKTQRTPSNLDTKLNTNQSMKVSCILKVEGDPFLNECRK